MARTGIEWVVRPSAEIGRNLARAGAGGEAAIGEMAAFHAARGETRMKTDAPWQDQTGNARGSLFGTAEGTDVVLGGTANYLLWLEIGTTRMSPYPIIRPTTDAIAPEYFEDSGKVLMRLLAGKT